MVKIRIGSQTLFYSNMKVAERELRIRGFQPWHHGKWHAIFHGPKDWKEVVAEIKEV